MSFNPKKFAELAKACRDCPTARGGPCHCLAAAAALEEPPSPARPARPTEAGLTKAGLTEARLTEAGLIEERRRTHGDWADVAKTTRLFKEVFREALDDREGRGDAPLAPTQMEAIEMMLAKVARIVSGDPGHPDHWDDIAGYARLVRGDANG